jgi:hypothetical protein
VKDGSAACRTGAGYIHGRGAAVGLGLGVVRGLAVGVGLGVELGDIVGVEVGVPVGVAVAVDVGVDVGVIVAVGVAEAVAVAVGVGDGGVPVAVAVGVGVGCGTPPTLRSSTIALCSPLGGSPIDAATSIRPSPLKSARVPRIGVLPMPYRSCGRRLPSAFTTKTDTSFEA